MLEREWAGSVAVGAILMFGFFLVLNASTDIMATVEEAGSTATWGILAAIPTVAIAHVAGTVLTMIGAAVFGRLIDLEPFREAETFARLARETPEALREYAGLIRQARFILGSPFAFAALACGAFVTGLADRRHVEAGVAVSAGSLILAAICPLLARQILIRAHRLAEACNERH